MKFEELPDLETSVTSITKRQRERLADLVNQRVVLKEKEEGLEVEKGELNDQIEDLMAATGLTGVRSGGWRVDLVSGTSRHISKELLLANGVRPAVIEKATTEKAWTAVRVGRGKRENEE